MRSFQDHSFQNHHLKIHPERFTCHSCSHYPTNHNSWFHLSLHCFFQIFPSLKKIFISRLLPVHKVHITSQTIPGTSEVYITKYYNLSLIIITKSSICLSKHYLNYEINQQLEHNTHNIAYFHIHHH